MEIGNYRILRRLAVGGMGEIFLGRQVGAAGFDRPVIIKRLLPDLAEDDHAVADFLDEARIAATLNHPNIVAIYEVTESQGVYFIAMEYIDGETIAKMLTWLFKRKEGVPYGVAARIIHDAALALDHAHEAKGRDGRSLELIHRDVSPQNIMVRLDGVTKVVDFGIAKVSDRSSRTSAGALKGKLRYMAPEQLRHERLDHRSDQFSLGVTLWEMCAGRRLFKRDLSIAARLAATNIPAVSRVRPDVPRELDRIVGRMVAADRDARFASCGAAADALQRFMDSAAASDLRDVASLVRHTAGAKIEERREWLRADEPSEELDVLQFPVQRPDSVSDTGDDEQTVQQTPRDPPDGRTLQLNPYSSQSVADLQPRRRAWPLALLVLVLTLAAAGGGFALLSRRDAPPPVVMIKRDPGSEETETRPEPKAPTGPRARLTRAFAKRRPAIERCFEGAAESPSRLSIRFEVATSGRVASATVLPKSVAGTEIGRCLIEVARTTKFPPQAKPVAFRIPLRAR